MSLSLRDPWKNIKKTSLIQVTPRLYAKLETENPTGSIKDRPIQYIVSRALASGDINSETTLVEASSGNTGISLCAIGASLGLRVKIMMPVNMSEERKVMMASFGAKVLDAPPSDFAAAIKMRNDSVFWEPNHWSPMQFENPQNIACHRDTTAVEIYDQTSTSSTISAFFSGAGTGGTIMGFRERSVLIGSSTKCMLVVPAEPPEIHGIQGIGDGDDYLVKRSLLDGVHPISTRDAINRSREFARSRGLLVGISSGANLLAAEKYIRDVNPPGIVVTILCDRGERYLSSK
jgi:cysteine synthase A